MKITKISQFEEDNDDFLIELQDEIQQDEENAAIEAKKIPVIQLKTTSCTTTYNVGGVTVKLWMITGGTPALAIMGENGEYLLDKKYPDVQQWSNENWLKDESRYRHQNPNAIQGPTYDVLPNGKQDLIDFVVNNDPKAKLKQSRYKALPVKGTIKGKKALDKTNRSYSQPTLTLTPNYLYVRTPKPQLYHPWWSKMLRFYDSTLHVNRTTTKSYDEMSDTEFTKLVNLLNEGILTGVIKTATNEHKLIYGESVWEVVIANNSCT